MRADHDHLMRQRRIAPGQHRDHVAALRASFPAVAVGLDEAVEARRRHKTGGAEALGHEGDGAAPALGADAAPLHPGGGRGGDIRAIALRVDRARGRRGYRASSIEQTEP